MPANKKPLEMFVRTYETMAGTATRNFSLGEHLQAFTKLAERNRHKEGKKQAGYGI